MKLHLAGADNSPNYNTLLHDAGAVNRLESYHSLGKKVPSSGFETLLLDSGGFVARTRGIVIDVATFAKYINDNNVKLAFNLDTNDVEETLRNQRYLEQNTSCYIIPVYHLSDYLSLQYRDLIDDFVKEYPYISIGGTAGGSHSYATLQEFFKHTFYRTRDKTMVHGLGITAKPALQQFPFYSVDSTSWLSAARYGNTKTTECEMVASFYAKKRHYLLNTKREVDWWVRMEEFITNLWEKRGVTWESFKLQTATQKQ